MSIYEREAVPLSTEAARQALSDYTAQHGYDPTPQITHLVVVSCTGFFAPGLDTVLAQALGLSPRVERTLIGFMGCAAAFNGLRTAQHIVRSQPEALVLVVCVELGSIHIQPEPSRENLLSAALFGDGASACVVGTGPAPNSFSLEAFHTALKPDTSSAMMWHIGNHGFRLRLSPQVPAHVGDIAPAVVQCLFPTHRPDFWAIHPGGRAIVDQLENIFQLKPAQVASSRAVLRQVGNLSSATMFFVLADLRRRLDQRSTGVAMAFGPGLVIEIGRLTYVP